MPCIETRLGARRRVLVLCAFSAVLLVACSSRESAPPRPEVAPAAPAAPFAKPAPALPAPPRAAPARNWDEYRVQAARRMVAHNPQGSYTGEVVQPLLAIPVLEIELQRDGQVQRIKVLRHPSQAEDTVQLAIAAVERSAPFGDASRLPRPWKFTETFLFNEQRRFKPRSLED